MSYDLNFRGDIDLAAVRDYFTEADYTVDDASAGIFNKTTGVYWNFYFDDANRTFSFNLNYYRPHVFGLEAQPALTALVEHFDLAIDDPQASGMGEGPYTPAGFLRGWNAGNRSGYSAIAAMKDAEPPLTLPAATNASTWRWNYAKAGMDPDEFDEDDELQPFVPTVMLLLPDGTQTVKTGVIWALDIPIAIPANVDLVVSMATSGEGLVAAPRADVVALLDLHSTWDAHQTHAYQNRPIGTPADRFDALSESTQQRVRAIMRPFAARRIETDKVLDAELVAAAAKR